ncbi:MAG: hypothetical protein M1833_002723 [Piccolia ochrophora]|nr:MAG: hypothetical protein M1833_002723 [Piccolia ochrophora]
MNITTELPIPASAQGLCDISIEGINTDSCSSSLYHGQCSDLPATRPDGSPSDSNLSNTCYPPTPAAPAAPSDPVTMQWYIAKFTVLDSNPYREHFPRSFEFRYGPEAEADSAYYTSGSCEGYEGYKTGNCYRWRSEFWNCEPSCDGLYLAEDAFVVSAR